jgi:sugar/nucleoside kinase (ribokinase family)
VDHCIINEIEAERTTGVQIRQKDESIDRGALIQVAEKLLEHGVSTTVVIHAPEGGQWLDRKGNELFIPSLQIPQDQIVGTVGAGDAFCAGILYALHEGWSAEQALQIGGGTAATCIGAANTTDGVRSLEEVRALCSRWAADK